MAETQTEHPNPGRWWKHRRRGYYSGMVWALFQTGLWILLEYNKPGTVQNMGVVIGWSYGISATLIVSYFGNTIAESWSGKVKQ